MPEAEAIVKVTHVVEIVEITSTTTENAIEISILILARNASFAFSLAGSNKDMTHPHDMMQEGFVFASPCQQKENLPSSLLQPFIPKRKPATFHHPPFILSSLFADLVNFGIMSISQTAETPLLSGGIITIDTIKAPTQVRMRRTKSKQRTICLVMPCHPSLFYLFDTCIKCHVVMRIAKILLPARKLLCLQNIYRNS